MREGWEAGGKSQNHKITKWREWVPHMSAVDEFVRSEAGVRDCVLDILNAWMDQTTNGDGASRLGVSQIKFDAKLVNRRESTV